MKKMIVVHKPEQWKMQIEGVEIVSSQAYLTEPEFGKLKNARVFNLCNEYSYQTRGYYVSLLAEARGHQPLPNVSNILDLRAPALVRIVSENLDDLIQSSLKRIRSKDFLLSIYFGQNLAGHYAKLCAELHKHFPAPIIRARFHHSHKWILQGIKAIPMKEIPEEHFEYVQEFARQYFSKKRYHKPRSTHLPFSMAILVNPKDNAPPSNPKAIQKFCDAAEKLNIETEIIGPDDYHRLPAFDALFIRENTQVNHHTYHFARRAQQDGLSIIDYPESILKCGNKVYINELLQAARIPTPRTIIVSNENKDRIADELGLPCVVKLPDSTFSFGVKKADSRQELKDLLNRTLEHSDLVMAQEFTYSDYDWRIGTLDGEVFFVCKYYMAEGHWQIYNWDARNADDQTGNVDCVPLKDVPASVMRIGKKLGKLMGRGLYGIDVKQIGKKAMVIEVNDCPNIDTGCEDLILGDAIYMKVMQAFKMRIEERLGLSGYGK